jgi:hypothetical protein
LWGGDEQAKATVGLQSPINRVATIMGEVKQTWLANLHAESGDLEPPYH